MAVTVGNLDLLQDLLEETSAEAAFDPEALQEAVSLGRLEILDELTQAGARLMKDKGSTNASNKIWSTLLDRTLIQAL